MRTRLLLFVAALWPSLMVAQDIATYRLSQCRYWFDDESNPRIAAYTAGSTIINVSALDEGFHTLHYQVLTSQGQASPVRTTSFYRISFKSDAFKDYAVQTVRYWYDDEKTPRTADYKAGTTNFDASELDEGFHTLHYQVVTDQGQTSPVRTTSFYRITFKSDAFKNYAVQTVRYWFDDEKTPRTADYKAGTTNFDASELDEGFHTLHYQVVADQGQTSPVRTTSFYRITPKSDAFKDYAVQTVRYWFDNDITTMQSKQFIEGTEVLDLSFLTDGEHTLCYQVIADDGQVSPVRSVTINRIFYDIYISRLEEYNDSLIGNDPLFASRPDLKLHFVPDDINVRGHLTVDEGTTLSLGKFVQTANWGSKNDGSKYNKAGVEYYHPTTLQNDGNMRADSVIVKQSLYRDRWHFISLPFNVKVCDIETPNDTYWALRRYDGEARATGLMNETWQNLRQGDQMESGRGYIVQLTKEGNGNTSELIFKALNDPKKNNIFTTGDVTTPLEEHPSEFAHNRSWNLVGNPYPSFFDTRYIEQDGTIIVWNGNGYTAYSLVDDNYILMPFEAFFIQKPLNADALKFSKDGRQHTHEIFQRASSPRQVKSLQNRRILNFALTDGVETDHSRVVINEQASIGYETDNDAPKFMETRPNMPQLFSVESGVQYSINERPMGDGQIVFSLYAPVDGEYHFSVNGDVTNMIVLDTETGTSWPMADGDYVFTATEGMHKARLVVSLTGTTTDIAQINAYDDGEVRVADGLLSFRFIRNKHIKVFSIDGKLLYNDVASQANIKVARGIYVVDLDGKTIKIMVK